MTKDFILGFEYGRAIERRLIALKAFDGMEASVDLLEDATDWHPIYVLTVNGRVYGPYHTANELCDSIDQSVRKEEETMFDFELEEGDGV